MSVHAFIDGFNIYHVLEGHYRQTSENLKWLNYPKLISHIAGQDVSGSQVAFFTAPPKHLSYDKLTRHQIYCQSQAVLGVQIVEGRFKKSTIQCKSRECGAFMKYPVN